MNFDNGMEVRNVILDTSSDITIANEMPNDSSEHSTK